jgi:hypothetical protein
MQFPTYKANCIERVPYCRDSRLTDGGKVSLTRRPPLLRNIFISVSHFCYWLSNPQVLLLPDGKLIKVIHLILWIGKNMQGSGRDLIGRICLEGLSYILHGTNSAALSPPANYTDWATATCRRNVMPTFVDRGVSRGQRSGSPIVVSLSFLDGSRYFSFK